VYLVAGLAHYCRLALLFSVALLGVFLGAKGFDSMAQGSKSLFSKAYRMSMRKSELTSRATLACECWYSVRK
jgi:hypothetical protein